MDEDNPVTPDRDTPISAGTSAEEAALAAFFAAARAEDVEPRTALLSAILADAAEVHAARATAGSAPARPATATPVPRRRFGAGVLSPIGGWGGLAALGACAALGFWLGLAGNLSLDGASLTTVAASQSDAAETGAVAFFDYASLEQ